MSNKSVYQLFETLQFEYEVCILRSKIYPIVKHKEYWKDTAEKKKEKILDIAKRNNLPCIFDNEQIRKTFREKVYSDTGLPNFYYPDFQKQEQQKYWDTVNYFRVDSEVKFYDMGFAKVGTVKSIDLKNNKIVIKYTNTEGDCECQVNFNQASRIF